VALRMSCRLSCKFVALKGGRWGLLREPPPFLLQLVCLGGILEAFRGG
jgi:hypothetical protein